MTCIVGLVHDGKVLIGGDSAGVGGYDLTVRGDQKVWAKDGWAFGFTSSFRMGQLLRYSLHPPKRHPDTDLMQYMVTEFIDAVRKCLKDGGYATVKDGGEQAGCFLVGHSGRLFRVDSDYQVGESAAAYDAVGCGDSFAKGALFANARIKAKDPAPTQSAIAQMLDPRSRVLNALEAAEAMSAGVRGPFHIVTT
jgi:ATP-dependent protease HslVU (ClpYQ) peptidase subunit